MTNLPFPMMGTVLIGIFFNLAWASGYETTSGDIRSKDQMQSFRYIGVTKHVDLDSFQGNIKGVELECSQDADGKIGFCSNKNCQNGGGKDNKGVHISAEYAEFIENYGYKCVAMMQQKHNCGGRAAFCGIGGHAKRNARKNGDTGVPSRHSTGDAMDVSGSLMCNGKKIVEFTKNGRNNKSQAYDDFKKCWDEQVQEAVKREPNKYKANNGGCIGCTGSPGKNNDGHNDHIHISAPIIRKEPISNT
ncbi:MAG: hypothetical protein KDD33_06045 [Bdellovibrionales bacterium]|nr:hypothetical protein [Bdellovibrionales bacterium]